MDTYSNEYLTAWLVTAGHIVVANRGPGEDSWAVREQIVHRFVEHGDHPDRVDAEAVAHAVAVIRAAETSVDEEVA